MTQANQRRLVFLLFVEPLILSFEVHGKSGRPLVILHGLFGSGRNWQTIARRLSENHRILLPDLRNHGSSPHSSAMNYPHLAEDLWALLAQQRINRTALIGHSLGGKVAMWSALTQPKRIDQLVVVDIAPARYGPGFDTIIKALQSLPLAKIASRREADHWLAAKKLSDYSLRQFLLQNLIRHNGNYHWRIDLDIISAALPALLEFPLDNGIAPFERETLFVRGSESSYIDNTHEPIILKYFPNARIETLEEAGHWPHAQQPAKFLDLVTNFLLA